MKILFDTNVILDVLLAREPHADIAAQLFALADNRAIDGAVCATTVTTVHYLAAKAVGRKRAHALLLDLLGIFDVAPVDRGVLESALGLDFPDFEDAVLHEAARASGMTAIVTRNGRDFSRATLPILDPIEMLAGALAIAD